MTEGTRRAMGIPPDAILAALRCGGRRVAPAIALSGMVLLAPLIRAVDPSDAAVAHRAGPLRPAVETQPVVFEANRGQADPRVRYLSRARDYTVALTDDEALLLVRTPTVSGRRGRLQAGDMALLRMRLRGAAKGSRITALEPLPGKVYLADSSERGPLTPIDTFARVQYQDVYPGIDLVYYGDEHQLEFDFVVAPHADPTRVALSLEGADRLRLTEAGDLSMSVGGSEVRLEKPTVYQYRDGQRIEVPASYLIAADRAPVVGFRLGSYDPSLPLVIDPTWMTVFGSTNDDWLSGFAVDSTGHTRVLGATFDPAAFPFTQVEEGVLPPPHCFMTKLDAATGLNVYTILFRNTQNCGPLTLAPNDVAYFTGFVYPNGFPNNHGTTVTSVDDSSGVPVIDRFVVGNYDSTAVGEGVHALTVNSLGHVFLLGPCRLVGAGDAPLELSGYNETPDAPQGVFAEGCTLPGAGSTAQHQPLLTVVDNSGAFLYASFLSPGEFVTKYGLAADDSDRAYIVGAASSTIAPTADAYRSACPAAGTRGFDLCSYLMVLDSTTVGPASLLYASYLWNTGNTETAAVRLGPAGQVYVASDGQVFDDFPSNRPTGSAPWQYSVYPDLRDGIQLALFTRDASGLPSLFEFATIFDPHRGVAALAGHTVRDALADLRLFPSGAPAIATIAYTQTLAPLGIVTTLDPRGEGVGEVWTHNLGTRTPVGFAVGTGAGGALFLAGQVDRPGAQDSDIFVEQLEALDPGVNRPPTVFIFENVPTVYADSPTGGALLQFNAIASDPDGDTLTYSWTGPFTDNPVSTNHYLVARVPLGMQQTVTVTVDDGHGNVVSASRTFDVVGTPFVGTTATPVDSQINGLVFNYAPVTITASAIGAGGGNAYLRTRLDQNPPIPTDLQAGSPPIYFELSTDAALAAPLSVCVDTRGMSFANPGGIRLYQYLQSSWTDVTSPGYPQGSQLCGHTNTLGTFAIFYAQVPVTAVQTIAGNGVLAGSNDGPGGSPVDDVIDGPARQTALPNLFGGAYDRANNRLFVSGGGSIFQVNLSDDTIMRLGTDVGFPMELTVAPDGDVVFIDRNTCTVRRIDLAQGSLHAVAGNGTCGFSGDGGPATLAAISPGAMAFDSSGNLFIADPYAASIRRIDAATGVIDTVAGDGSFGTPTHGAPARSAIGLPAGLAFDAQGHLIVAAGMHLIRISTGTADGLIDGDADEVISVLGGCNTNCMAPYNGDGLAISHPQVYLPGLGHVTVAQDGAVIFVDYFRIRRIVPGADGIVTGASDEIVSTVGGYYDWETSSLIPNFNGDRFSTQSRFSRAQFVVDDTQSRIVVVDGNNFRVRRFGLAPGGAAPLTIQTAGVADAAEDQLYSATITATGGSGSGYGWSISAGALPAGITLAATGTPATTLSGTPTEGGTFDFTVTVTDSGGNTGSRAFTLVVAHAVVRINVTETVGVTDAVALRPSAMVSVIEQIVVTDGPGVVPSAMIRVNEVIGVTDAPAVSVDDIAPVLTLPPTIVAEAQSPGGAVVTFEATAADNSAGAVTVTCTPASGALFPFNGTGPTTTTVTCTATDSSANTASGSFDVIVRDTTAPQVLTAQLTVAATEPAGARGNVPQAPHTPILQQIPLLGGAIDAADPNPARVSAQWVACAEPAQVLGPILDTTLYPVGANCFAYVFRDGSGNVGTGIGTIEVSPPIGGPVMAANVAVTATDLFNVPLPVTATFLALDQPGLLTAVAPQFLPPPAAGLRFVGAPLDIRTTALAPHAVVVCMRPPLGEPAERLLTLENFQWVDRTQSVDPATNEVCGRVGPLGTFALVRRDLSGLTVTLSPASSIRPLGDPIAFEAVVGDSSAIESRVAIRSTLAVNVEFRDPLGPNSPLSLVVLNDASGAPENLIVSLATGLAGELRSTAAEVANLLTTEFASRVGPGLLTATWWPETRGEGIVAARPLLRLARLDIRSDAYGPISSCYISTPGICPHEYTRNSPSFELVTAHLDLNHNQVVDAGELTAQADVSWIDVTPPVLTLPSDITVSAAGPDGTVVSFTVTASDDSDPNVPPSCSPASGTTFPIGMTTVTCTATDASGNARTGSFTVTVAAPPAPSVDLYVPGDITVPATSPSGAVVEFVAEAYASAFGGSFQVPVSCSPSSGATFPIGTTTVTCTARNPFLLPGVPNVPATRTFTVTVLPYVPPPPLISSLTPASAAVGGGAMLITVTGSGFASGATAFWNGASRPTVVTSATQLTVSIPATDFLTAADLTTVLVTAGNPGSSPSSPMPFLITSAQVVTVDAQVARGGESAVASNAPAQPTDHGVTAALINNDPSSAPVAVAVASYGSNPVGDASFAAGGFFDIQVTGADPTDALVARFYYPGTVTGLTESRLRLLYWDGTAWSHVIGSAGVLPLKDTTDDLDGTTSGGRFTVTLDSTSIPRITDLSGTVFALVEDLVAPVTTITQSPAANAAGWNNTSVMVTLEAADDGPGVVQTEYAVNGGSWQIYAGPIVLDEDGMHGLSYRSIDEAGNIETAKGVRVRIDRSEPLSFPVALPTLLLPANRRMVDVTVLPLAVDLLSGVDEFVLVSVTCDDPGLTPDDVAGWTIGTTDTQGKLRAERTASGGRRTYRLTYRVTDRAGNEVLATAFVVVPGTRD